MYNYPDGDTISKPCMILSFGRRIQKSYEVRRLMVTNETLYDSVVLAKDSGVIQGLLLNGGQ